MKILKDDKFNSLGRAITSKFIYNKDNNINKKDDYIYYKSDKFYSFIDDENKYSIIDIQLANNLYDFNKDYREYKGIGVYFSSDYMEDVIFFSNSEDDVANNFDNYQYNGYYNYGFYKKGTKEYEKYLNKMLKEF